MSMHKGFCVAASVSGASAVILGAFGAHALKERLTEYALSVYTTGVDYHFYHTAALLAVALLPSSTPSKLRTASGVCFVLGILFFSGSLYALALSGITKLGLITPIGGLLFIAGWILLMITALRSPQSIP